MNRLQQIRVYLLLALVSSSLTGVYSQDQNPDDKIFFFKGRVVDTLSSKPVAFVHVVNTVRRRATICDTMGYFFLRARVWDTLQFTAIGYAPKELVINDSLAGLTTIPNIPMHTVTYSIDGVMINPLGSYEAFKSKVINLELPPSGFTIHENVTNEIKEAGDEILIPAGISPVTALYNWLSKEGREKRKYRQILEQKQFEKDIAYKYSPLIVSGITGYGGVELYVFMDFCEFSNKFLEESDRYEIRDAVIEKQLEYEAVKTVE